MLEFYPAILAAVIHASSCSLPVINDDSGFTDSYPSDTNWIMGSNYTGAFEIAFNMARAKDSTVNAPMRFPTQAVWDTMNNQEKALYILNRERYDRGLKPFEGFHDDVIGVAQNYAQHLYDTVTFGHEEDGTPWERLDRVPSIAANRDFFSFAENLANSGYYNAYPEEVVVKAIYNWIYDDGYVTGGTWGHRDFCLAKELNDNSGEQGKEGLVGFGVVQGTDYYEDPDNTVYSTVIVMNAFDPGSGWNHSASSSVSICSDLNPPSTRFSIDYADNTITDTQNSTMWTLTPLDHTTPDEAAAVCSTSTHAGFNDWQIPNQTQAGIFHAAFDAEQRTPPQRFAHCTAEVVSDGYVRTKRGAIVYGGTPGSSIGFGGGANVRCMRPIP